MVDRSAQEFGEPIGSLSSCTTDTIVEMLATYRQVLLFLGASFMGRRQVELTCHAAMSKVTYTVHGMYDMYLYNMVSANEMQSGQAAHSEASWGLWQVGRQVLGQHPTSQPWLQQQLQQLLLQEIVLLPLPLAWVWPSRQLLHILAGASLLQPSGKLLLQHF